MPFCFRFVSRYKMIGIILGFPHLLTLNWTSLLSSLAKLYSPPLRSVGPLTNCILSAGSTVQWNGSKKWHHQPAACYGVAPPHWQQIRSNFLPKSETNSLAHLNSQVESNFSKFDNTFFQPNYLHWKYLKAFAETHFFPLSDRINVKWTSWVDYILSDCRGLTF